jgi:carbonic anhydrase
MANNKQSQGISRRHLMQLTGAGVLATGLGAKLIAPNEASASEVAEITADRALQKLMEGNKRYIDFKRTYPDQDQVRLKAVAQDQHPFAVILGCADSRVPPELLFDQGLILAELVQQGKLKVVGGRYDLDNGAIEMIA